MKVKKPVTCTVNDRYFNVYVRTRVTESYLVYSACIVLDLNVRTYRGKMRVAKFRL